MDTAQKSALMAEIDKLSEEDRASLRKVLGGPQPKGFRKTNIVGQEVCVLPANKVPPEVREEVGLRWVWAVSPQKLTIVAVPPDSEEWPKKYSGRKKENAE